MQDDFPRVNRNRAKGQSGQTYFQLFVEDTLGWIYHPILEQNDFGIDGYVEVVTDGKATGKLIGVQIKHGDSYFKPSDANATTYVGETRHLNYYLNNNCPIVIVVLDDSFLRRYWVQFDIGLTSPAGARWSQDIPNSNELDASIGSKWHEIAGSCHDYLDEVKWNWELDKLMMETGVFVLAVPKAEVEGLRFDTLLELVRRLTKNERMRLQLRSTIELYFPDYQNDTRELFNIPEIGAWFRKAFEEEVPLAYFLNYKIRSYTLFLLGHSICGESFHDAGNVGGFFRFSVDPAVILDLSNSLFENLNKFCDVHSIPETINEEISKGIFEYYLAQFGLAEFFGDLRSDEKSDK